MLKGAYLSRIRFASIVGEEVLVSPFYPSGLFLSSLGYHCVERLHQAFLALLGRQASVDSEACFCFFCGIFLYRFFLVFASHGRGRQKS